MLLLLLPVIAIFVGVVWWLSVRSRRSYVCPSCGNAITVERMQASSCNICGAELREVPNA